jgi:hypothetical protein
MNNMFKIIKNQQGVTALMLTLLILTSVLTVSLAMADVIRNGLIMDKTQFGSTRAYFAAEAAAERILWAVRYGNFHIDTDCTSGQYVSFNDSDCGGSAPCCLDSAVQHSLGSSGAVYSIKYEYDASAERKNIITNIGSYRDVNRIVELRY